MWRAEDIFFAALGGGGFGQPPIEKPEELAERVTAEDARTITYVNAPMMHGGGQWVVVHHLLRRRHRRAEHDAPLRSRRRVARRRRASGATRSWSSATPWAGRWPRRWPRRAPTYDTSSVIIVGSGGAILSPAVKEQLRARLPNAMVMDSFGASETGAGGTVYDTQGPAAGPRFTMGPFMTVLGDDLRPGRHRARASSAAWRAAGTSRSATTRTRRRRRRRSSTDADGKRWVVPGDSARIEEDGTITVLGRGSVCINTGGEKVYPEEVEAALKSHPDVFDAVVVGVPDDRFGERSRRHRAAAAGGIAGARRAAGALPHPARRLQGAAPARGARRDRAHPGRQARLPVGEADRDRTRGELNGRCRLGFWTIAQEEPDKLAVVDPDERLVLAGELLGVGEPGRARPARPRPAARRRGRDGAAELRRGVRALPRGAAGRLLPRADQQPPRRARDRLHRAGLRGRRCSSATRSSPTCARPRRRSSTSLPTARSPSATSPASAPTRSSRRASRRRCPTTATPAWS